MYRIFFVALRAQHEASLRALLQHAKFVQHLVEHTTTAAEPPASGPAATSGAENASSKSPAKASGAGSGGGPAAAAAAAAGAAGSSLAFAVTPLTGQVLAFASALRLEASALPPSSWLRIFLQNHVTWRRFLPVLEAATLARERARGFGLRVPGEAPPRKPKPPP